MYFFQIKLKSKICKLYLDSYHLYTLHKGTQSSVSNLKSKINWCRTKLFYLIVRLFYINIIKCFAIIIDVNTI